MQGLLLILESSNT